MLDLKDLLLTVWLTAGKAFYTMEFGGISQQLSWIFLFAGILSPWPSELCLWLRPLQWQYQSTCAGFAAFLDALASAAYWKMRYSEHVGMMVAI